MFKPKFTNIIEKIKSLEHQYGRAELRLMMIREKTEIVFLSGEER